VAGVLAVQARSVDALGRRLDLAGRDVGKKRFDVLQHRRRFPVAGRCLVQGPVEAAGGGLQKFDLVHGWARILVATQG